MILGPHGNTARPAPNHRVRRRYKMTTAKDAAALRVAPLDTSTDLRANAVPEISGVCALPEDQEFPLAHIRPALPRLSSPPRRAGRADFRDHRRHRRAGEEDRRHK